MTVFTGEQGLVRLRRNAGSGAGFESRLNPDDVNVARKRFSFERSPHVFITGDRMEIATEDKSILELVAGHNYRDGAWYVHVDDTGGLRLYSNFDDAVNGSFANALPLIKPSATVEISAHTRDFRFNGLSQIQSWAITTSRQTIDTTVLGEEFVEQFSRGLISGQGQLTALWDYRKALCDSVKDCDGGEEPNYLCQLLLRLEQGARFDAEFYVLSNDDKSVWYEAECIITNVGLEFSPGLPVTSSIDFVMTGPISLHVGEPLGYVLQEDTEGIVLEEGNGLLALEEAL